MARGVFALVFVAFTLAAAAAGVAAVEGDGGDTDKFFTPNPSLEFAAVTNFHARPGESPTMSVRRQLGESRAMLEVTVNELKRLRRVRAERVGAINKAFKTLTDMQARFHDLYEKHEKATQGPTIDDKKEDKQYLAPLQKLQQDIKQTVAKHASLIKGWADDAWLNTDLQLVYENVMREEALVLGMVQTTAAMMPVQA